MRWTFFLYFVCWQNREFLTLTLIYPHSEDFLQFCLRVISEQIKTILDLFKTMIYIYHINIGSMECGFRHFWGSHAAYFALF